MINKGWEFIDKIKYVNILLSLYFIDSYLK